MDSSYSLPIVDSHLDLAESVTLFGRELTISAGETRRWEKRTSRQASYMAQLVGSWEHLGIGSDLDGGLGLEESPLEIDTVADLYKIGSVMPTEARDGVLSTNWLNFLRRSLPQSA
jgi:membrane dipeptidase